MNMSMIVAMDKNRVIGKDNDIPWKLPKDQAYFRKVTMGHSVIMGRKNYESIGRPLGGRRNIIVTRDKQYTASGCEIVHSVEEVLSMVKNEEEPFVIGGEEIYKVFLPYATKLYITTIEHEFEGDTYFPRLVPDEWKVVSVEKGITDEKNVYEYVFTTYERVNQGS
ncbi:dihydrofolate reductase [Aneurinibacillus sp. REN35]|uniref:dihydrofolate reductase n=1 Tax=Aneurinibacillus sp. REN35 TaxID=3237286 RepID=UPI0035299E11